MEDATHAEQIAEMYNNQVDYTFSQSCPTYFSLTPNLQDIIKNQNKDKKTSPEDDFDF